MDDNELYVSGYLQLLVYWSMKGC